jgi:hypothetical protein
VVLAALTLMFAQLSTVKSRLAILGTDTQYDAILTTAIKARTAQPWFRHPIKPLRLKPADCRAGVSGGCRNRNPVSQQSESPQAANTSPRFPYSILGILGPQKALTTV